MAEPLTIAEFTISVVLTEDDEIVSLEVDRDEVGYSQGLGWLTMALDTWRDTHGFRVQVDDD